jgi:hypothetical protein
MFHFKHDCTVSVFVKEEKHLVTDEDCEPEPKSATHLPSNLTNLARHIDPVEISTTKDPRIISPFTPRFNLVFMRFIVPVERAVYENLNRIYGDYCEKWGRPRMPCVFKGLNADQQGDVIARTFHSFVRPKAILLDLSRFDCHVTVNTMRWLHGIYENMLLLTDSDRKILLLLLKHCCKPSCRSAQSIKDGVLRYKGKGGLCTGAVDTSLMAIFIVISVFFCWAFKQDFFVGLVDCGDDHNAFVDERNLATFVDDKKGFVAHWRDFGFSCKVDGIAGVLEQVRFCSAYPIRVRGGWRMTRPISAAITKDLVCFHPVAPGNIGKLFRKYAAAVALGGLALYSSIPILGAFYRWLHRFSRSERPLKLDAWNSYVILGKGITRLGDIVEDYSRVSFALSTGLAPSLQLQWEHYFDNKSIDFTEGDSTACFLSLLELPD